MVCAVDLTASVLLWDHWDQVGDPLAPPPPPPLLVLVDGLYAYLAITIIAIAITIITTTTTVTLGQDQVRADQQRGRGKEVGAALSVWANQRFFFFFRHPTNIASVNLVMGCSKVGFFFFYLSLF